MTTNTTTTKTKKAAAAKPAPETTDNKPWWKGNGKGYIRPFITQDDELVCRVCDEAQLETAFPTLTIPRKDGRKRGLVCRECVKAQRVKNVKAAARKAAAKKAAATRKAKSTSTAA